MSKISQEYDRSAPLSKEILRYIVGKECKRRKSLCFAQSSMYLCSSPRVQANMEAILFVLVSWPFWCSRKCRVTVPWAASASNVLPSEDNCNFIVVMLLGFCANQGPNVWWIQTVILIQTNTEVMSPKEPNPEKNEITFRCIIKRCLFLRNRKCLSPLIQEDLVKN